MVTRVKEGGGEQSSGDRNNTDADNQDKGGKDPPASSDGVDISIADGSEGADGPPKRFKDRGEILRLGLVLEEIDAACGEIKDNGGDETREDDFLARDVKGATHALKGGTVLSEF